MDKTKKQEAGQREHVEKINPLETELLCNLEFFLSFGPQKILYKGRTLDGNI